MDLGQMLFGNTVREWFVAAGIFALSVIAIWAVQRYALKAFSRFASNTQTSLDDFVAELLNHTKFWLILIVAVLGASLSLNVSSLITLVLSRASAIAIVIQMGIWASAAITFWVERFVHRTAGKDAGAVTTVSAVSFVGRLMVWSIVLLLILDNLGVEVTALLAGLGIGGIAVALAAQNILGDLFASLSIILDKPFVLGDFLVLGDYKGTVEQIGLKTTRIRSLGGEQLIVGNDDLLNSRILNLGRMSDRRASFNVGVTYDTPRHLLEQIPSWIQELVEAQDHTRFDRSHLFDYGDYSINFETVFYLEVPEYVTYMDVQQAIKLGLHERFEQHGVEFAYPTQVVFTIPGVVE